MYEMSVHHICAKNLFKHPSMLTYQVGLLVSSFVLIFIYIHTSSMRSTNALVSLCKCLCICTGSPEHSLLDNAISIKIACAGLIIVNVKYFSSTCAEYEHPPSKWPLEEMANFPPKVNDKQHKLTTKYIYVKPLKTQLVQVLFFL